MLSFFIKYTSREISTAMNNTLYAEKIKIILSPIIGLIYPIFALVRMYLQ